MRSLGFTASGKLHTDITRPSHAVGGKADGGFAAGAGPGEEVHDDRRFVVRRHIAEQLCQLVMVLGIVEHLGPHKGAKVFHGHLRLLIKICAANHCSQLFFASLFFILLIRVVIQFDGKWTKMCFPEWRFGMIRAEHDDASVNSLLHCFRGGKTPSSLGNNARQLSFRVEHVVTGTTATGPRNVIISPRAVGINTPVAAPLL